MNGTPTEGFRTFIYLVEIVFVFFFIFMLDLYVIKGGLLYYLIFGLGVVVISLLLFLLVRDISKYFNY